MTDDYVPTLREYADVIDWLWTERHDPVRNRRSGVSTFDMPPDVRLAFNDALHRSALGRVARAMTSDS